MPKEMKAVRQQGTESIFSTMLAEMNISSIYFLHFNLVLIITER